MNTLKEVLITWYLKGEGLKERRSIRKVHKSIPVLKIRPLLGVSSCILTHLSWKKYSLFSENQSHKNLSLDISLLERLRNLAFSKICAISENVPLHLWNYDFGHDVICILREPILMISTNCFSLLNVWWQGKAIYLYSENMLLCFNGMLTSGVFVCVIADCSAVWFGEGVTEEGLLSGTGRERNLAYSEGWTLRLKSGRSFTTAYSNDGGPTSHVLHWRVQWKIPQSITDTTEAVWTAFFVCKNRAALQHIEDGGPGYLTCGLWDGKSLMTDTIIVNIVLTLLTLLA